jgi:hypothetical protein
LAGGLLADVIRHSIVVALAGLERARPNLLRPALRREVLKPLYVKLHGRGMNGVESRRNSACRRAWPGQTAKSWDC